MHFGPIEPEATCYTEEELETCRREAKDVLRLWNAFSELVQNSPALTGTHPPPAMTEHYLAMLNGNSPFETLLPLLPQDEDTLREATVTLWNTIAYGDVLFRFGQYCVSQELFHGKLVRCKCDALTDEDLKDFLGEEGK